MASIIDKAREYSPDNNESKDAFLNGALWMLEKAMVLIKDSVIFDKFERPVKSETFRKAMEE